MLDVRRTLDFLLLAWNPGKQEFVTASKKKFPDDMAITDVGLSPLEYSRLLDVGMRVIGMSPTRCLLEARTYANKDLAHFADSENLPELQGVIDVTKVMHEAILVFIYDALGMLRPKLQPTVHEG